MAYVDLDELPGLLGGRLVSGRPGLVRFRRADYLGDPATPLADAVRAVVAEHTGAAPDGPIRLLTHLRSLGRGFNPVSFYYCFDARRALRAVVAEVTNTPWGERHAYVLDRRRPGAARRAREGVPRLAVHGHGPRYGCARAGRATTLSVHIESREDGRRAFDATLSLRRRPFRAVACSALRILPLIYAHAIAGSRARKGVPDRRPVMITRRPRLVLRAARAHRVTASSPSSRAAAAACSAPGSPQAMVHRRDRRASGARCCAAAAGSPRPTWTGCGTRRT